MTTHARNLETAITFEEFERRKQALREQLAAMDPGDAQQLADSYLMPQHWKVDDPSQLLWDGDLADDEDDE